MVIFVLKLSFQSLKMYGEGLRRLEEVTHEVALEFLEELAQCQGQPVDPYNASTRAIVNVLLTLVCILQITAIAKISLKMFCHKSFYN